MASRRKNGERRELDREHSSTPTQEDEADILAEAGAEPDESGELSVPEEKIRELGAVDADSVRENRRVETIVGKKRANMPNVSFNTGDVISSYDAILKVWAANTLEIHARRLTGTPVQHVIISRPGSGAALYEAIRLIHGQHEEAEYEIKVLDNSRKEWRSKGRIAMPDTRPQGQPMTYPPPYGVPPQGYAPQPGYGAPLGYQLQPQPVAPPPQPQQPVSGLPQQPPIVMHAPAGPDMNSMLGAFQQMFEMFRAMQPPPTAPAPAFAPQPQQQFMPPPPPPGSDMPAMMAWMKQAFDIFQSATPAPAAQPQAQAPSSAQAGPSMPPPPGMMWGWIPGFGFALMPAGERPGFGRPVGDPRPRPPYMQERGSPYPENRGAPPQRERSAREQFNDAISVVRTAVEAVNDINTLLPNAMGAVAEAATSGGDDDDSPVKVIDTGHGKFVLDKNNGGFRGWESLYANLPDLLKWGAEQREAIQKAHAEQQRPQQPQQLPQGYVEMVPGYQPPTGFVAVPVEQLPPPPTNMPPPIQPQRQPSPWGEPTVPEREE